ncbi:hypothetical protein [Tunturiibacter gelidiferens]|uniref:hypothetical protein n=1 Tax=Tunturiibacter gelidiferens TaxID=3069689 RepID=UPI003D9BA0DE
MPRPVKWVRDLHAIRARSMNSRTETWSRADIEKLFNVGRVTAQTLTRAIGEVQTVAGAHFVERNSLIAFLDAMIAAPSVDEALRIRVVDAPSPPRRGPLKVSLPADLRNAMVRDLPDHIRIAPGELTIRASGMENLLESLVALAKVLENDFAGLQKLMEVPPPPVDDESLGELLYRLRSRA